MPVTKKRSMRVKAAMLLLVMILPFNILGLVSSHMTYQSSLTRVEDMITYTMSSYLSLLTNRLTNADTTLYSLSQSNSDFITFAKQGDSWRYVFAKYQVYNTVKSYVSSSLSADQFFFYLAKKDDFLVVPYSRDDMDGLGQDELIKQVEAYQQNVGRWALVDHDGIPTLVKTFHDPSLQVYYGSCISLQAMLTDLKNAIGFKTVSFSFSPEALKSDRSAIAWSAEALPNLFLNASVARKEMEQSIGSQQYVMVALFLLYLLLAPVLFLLLNRYVSRPLRKLDRAHEQLAAGNEGYRITAATNSAEFDRAFRSFNNMAATLEQLRHDIVDKELANKQLQIDYLQLQIRPHFLLNTFNVLFTLIQRNQKQPAQDLVLYLSEYFRYLFRSGHELQPFAKELGLIQDYLGIAKIYHPDAFTVSYQLAPELSLMKVPPLLLHSFVENIIQHALVPGGVVHIVLSGEYEDGLVTFYISDDGKGMADAVTAAINNDAAPVTEGENVGLRNAIRRLAYYYGEQATVSVEAELGAGTTFTITIPYHLEDNENDAAIGE